MQLPNVQETINVLLHRPNIQGAVHVPAQQGVAVNVHCHPIKVAAVAVGGKNHHHRPVGTVANIVNVIAHVVYPHHRHILWIELPIRQNLHVMQALLLHPDQKGRHGK